VRVLVWGTLGPGSARDSWSSMFLDPLVSVVVSVLPSDPTLPTILNSVVGQTMTNIEVLVCTPDPDEGLGECASDARVHSIHVAPDRVTPADLIARGIEEARGSWVAFAAPRRLWSSGHLWSGLRSAQACGTEAAVARVQHEPTFGPLLPIVEALHPPLLRPQQIIDEPHLDLSGLIATRRLLASVGGVRRAAHVNPDLSLLLRLGIDAELSVSSEVVSCLREHSRHSCTGPLAPIARLATYRDFLMWLEECRAA
jgi:hypothetical protein